tara:strand:+ start:1448 stop:1921 length:474 start_codon:yes stop_codon:yes gene_type:complete
MNQIEGDLKATNLRIAFVVSKFNEFICNRLLEGALESFANHDGKKENITILRVPGAFELPLVAKKLATSGRFDAVVCLGAVIRGETSHYDYVCANASSGISSSSLETGIPISFGLLTTDTIEQAIERSGTKFGNQGKNATVCAIEMARLLKQISEAQ